MFPLRIKDTFLRASRANAAHKRKFASFHFLKVDHQSLPLQLQQRRLSVFKKAAYVHPLSQIVLEHLQSRHGGWLQLTGLEGGLHLKEDGTFTLHFPDSCSQVSDAVTDPFSQSSLDINQLKRNGRIWTMYEPQEKKHYLCVSAGNLVGRYLLQDNKKPAWHSDKKSTPKRVQDAVDEMIAKLSKEDL